MFAITKNNDGTIDISLTRGDTFLADVVLNTDDGAYEPQEGDVVRFALKKKYTDETPELIRVIPNDTLELELYPEDTKGYSLKEKFVYDIELTDAGGRVQTFIKGKLSLTEEVY